MINRWNIKDESKIKIPRSCIHKHHFQIPKYVHNKIVNERKCNM